MRRRVHRILLATVLALYGAVTLSGPALHQLPGSDHGGTTFNSGHGGKESPSDTGKKAAHDCPICHFLAQGQIDLSAAPGMLIDVARMRPASQTRLVFPTTPVRPSSPRAPPLV
jgi:Protein of unknown function (DUF2946)